MDIQKYKKFLLDFTDCDNYNLYDWFITKQIFSEDDLNIIYNSYLLKSYKINELNPCSKNKKYYNKSIKEDIIINIINNKNINNDIKLILNLIIELRLFFHNFNYDIYNPIFIQLYNIYSTKSLIKSLTYKLENLNNIENNSIINKNKYVILIFILGILTPLYIKLLLI